MNEPLIELVGVGKSYGGGDQPTVEVLRHLDLTVHAGEFVAIVGPSGSGKSTLMHILGCLDTPTSGTYRFAGRNIAALDPDRLARLRREEIGFVFQGYHLIPTESALENVELPALYAGANERERRDRAQQMLGRLSMGERMDQRPHQLSGGQQQRVSIARALMNGARVILADEPTGSLDTAHGAEVMRLFDDLAARGHTIILITHDRDVGAHASRVIEIRDGAIVHDTGTAERQKPPAPPAFDAPNAAEAGFLSNVRAALRAAWRTLSMSRFRTGLTLSGIVIGVASVILMLAVGEGARRKVAEELGAFGASTLYIWAEPPADGGFGGRITEGDMAAIAELPMVRRVLPTLENQIFVRFGSRSALADVQGVSHELPQLMHWPVAQGRYFTAMEARELTPVAVIGSQFRQRFFADGVDPVGKKLLLGRSVFEVIGVMSARGGERGANADVRVYVPYRSAAVRLFQTRFPYWVTIEVEDAAMVEEARKAIHATLLALHKQADFAVEIANRELKAELATRQGMTLMLALVAGVSLLVGGIGVMNVMLMTLKERTREIGIRMATGARQRDILRQFIAEALLVSVIGGIAGIAAGLSVAFALQVTGVPIGFSTMAVIAAFSSAVITGLVFGFMPARQAARLDPVRALVQP